MSQPSGNTSTLICPPMEYLIFGSSSYNLISYSLAVAGKFLNIPILSDFSQKRSSDKLSASNIKLFFENSVSTDDQTTKKFMRRGRFLVYKFLFEEI